MSAQADRVCKGITAKAVGGFTGNHVSEVRKATLEQGLPVSFGHLFSTDRQRADLSAPRDRRGRDAGFGTAL